MEDALTQELIKTLRVLDVYNNYDAIFFFFVHILLLRDSLVVSALD